MITSHRALVSSLPISVLNLPSPATQIPFPCHHPKFLMQKPKATTTWLHRHRKYLCGSTRVYLCTFNILPLSSLWLISENWQLNFCQYNIKWQYVIFNIKTLWYIFLWEFSLISIWYMLAHGNLFHFPLTKWIALTCWCFRSWIKSDTSSVQFDHKWHQNWA